MKHRRPLRRLRIVPTAVLAALAAAAFAPGAGATAESTLAEARRLKASAVEHMKRSRARGADEAEEAKAAVALLERARDLLAEIDKPGDEVQRELQDVNALIYWCRKMTAVKVAPPTATEEGPQRRGPRGRRVGRTRLAREAFEEVLEYARENEDRPLLIAARFLEVAERFEGTEWGAKARTLAKRYESRAGEKEEGAKVVSAAPGARAVTAVRPGTAERTTLITALAEALGKEGATDGERLAACESFLQKVPGDALAGEVAALARVFGTRTRRGRADEARRYFEEFPEGYFGRELQVLRSALEQETALSELVAVLRGKGGAPDFDELSRAAKAEACREFTHAFRSGPLNVQVRLLERVYSAPGDPERLEAWVLYREAFPDGFMMAHAGAFILKSEAILPHRIKEAVSLGEVLRAKTLGRAYVSMFREKPAAREITSLLQVLKESPGPDRAEAAQEFLSRHADGVFAEAVGGMVEKWRKATEELAYGRLAGRFNASQSDVARTAACEEFLAAFPEGDRAGEVDILTTVYGLEPTKVRLAAARRYRREHPGKEFAGAVREAEARLASLHEEELYRAVKERLADPRSRYVSRLAACKEYLAEAPDGPHAEEVRQTREQVLALMERESVAYNRCQSAAAKVKAPPEAVAIYDAFLKQHAGGLHAHRAFAEKAVFVARMRAEKASVAFRELMARLRRRDLSDIQRADACIAFLEKHRPGPGLRELAVKTLREYARVEIGRHAGPPRAAVFSPDEDPSSQRLVTIDADGAVPGSGVRIWKLPEMELVRVYEVRGGFTACSAAFLRLGRPELAAGPDEGRLLIGEDNGSLMIWDMEEGRIAGRWRLLASPLCALASFPTGAVVAAAGDDPKARVWDVSSWTCSDEPFACPGGCSAAAVTRSGDLVALGSRDGRVFVYDAGGGRPLWMAEDAFTSAVDDLAFAAGGAFVVAVSSGDGRAACFSAFTGVRLWESDDDSRWVAAVGRRHVLTSRKLRHAPNGSVVADIGASGPVAVSPDGRFAFAAEGEGGSVWYIPALVVD